ncbi:C-type lectin BfL-1-like [Haliotis rufescens]|uniref:C-type lectin BfL-1-like n=1 Tax=Haliotis rufescens TaxID=6454 RepID=UPI00201E919B|nr:C-type lectin BfL-1-like [Haliotis rufescens]XP_048252845.1 C-type lectin BfL-1-like [Haliotis rufescens]
MHLLKFLLQILLFQLNLLKYSEAVELLGFRRLERYDNVVILPNVPLLETPSAHKSVSACGRVCVSYPDCSLFSYNRITSECKLFPLAVYPADTFTLTATTSGLQYYAYNKDWCPVTNGFILDRETDLCFYVSEAKKNWADSITACQNIGMGARLMIIKDVDKQRKITSSLARDSTVKNEHAWIGGSDLDTTDGVYEFHWIDGTKVVNTFWGGSQPNGQLYNEYCLGINNAILYDRVCAHLYRYYCDIPN